MLFLFLYSLYSESKFLSQYFVLLYSLILSLIISRLLIISLSDGVLLFFFGFSFLCRLLLLSWFVRLLTIVFFIKLDNDINFIFYFVIFFFCLSCLFLVIFSLSLLSFVALLSSFWDYGRLCCELLYRQRLNNDFFCAISVSYLSLVVIRFLTLSFGCYHCSFSYSLVISRHIEFTVILSFSVLVRNSDKIYTASL